MAGGFYLKLQSQMQPEKTDDNTFRHDGKRGDLHAALMKALMDRVGCCCSPSLAAAQACQSWQTAFVCPWWAACHPNVYVFQVGEVILICVAVKLKMHFTSEAANHTQLSRTDVAYLLRCSKSSCSTACPSSLAEDA